MKRVYDNDLEKVDTMVGLMAEPLPEGFGFSDTAFRIFLLMASRRLKSDRFLSKDYRAEVYTKEGIDWVEQIVDDRRDHAALPVAGDAHEGARQRVQAVDGEEVDTFRHLRASHRRRWRRALLTKPTLTRRSPW